MTRDFARHIHYYVYTQLGFPLHYYKNEITPPKLLEIKKGPDRVVPHLIKYSLTLFRMDGHYKRISLSFCVKRKGLKNGLY